MKTPAEKIAMLKDESIKKRFRIIKRTNKNSPAAHYGAIYTTYRKKDVPYPVNETIVVFSNKLSDPTNPEKVAEECLVWGRNHGETHLAPAVKPLIEKYFEGKAIRDQKKEEKYQELKKKMGVE